MLKSEENNNPNVIKPIDHQGMVKRKIGPTQPNNRRPLSVVNENLVGSQGYPGVVNKKGLARKDAVRADDMLHQASRPVTRKDAVPADDMLHQASQPIIRKDAVRVDNMLHQASRPLTRKDEVCAENMLYLASRPVTRRFAAQLESRQVHGEECKNLKPTVPTANGSGENIFVDAGESEAPLDHPVPMYLEQSNEADQMEELEIMDTEEDQAIIDIDYSDLKNPLLVAGYVKGLYAYYKKMEIHSCVSPNYMAQQYDLNEKMRAILIDWLVEVHYKFELIDETLFLTVNIIDRFLSQHSVIRKKLQLVGLVALLIACKYEEVSVPVVNDLIIISDKAYTRQEVLEMERLMLNTLQFKVFFPTPYVFMRRFLKAAQSDKKLELLSFFLIELCLLESRMLKYPPSFLAAAAVYTAHCTLHGFREWTKTCEWHSGYSEDGLLECSRLMVGFHQKAARGKLTGVHRKYCTSKFCYIAKQEPARFF